MMHVFEKIESYNTSLSASKVARKYKLLLENPFRFFRGTNHLFYEDLAQADLSPAPACWICGDLHLENFGSYKGDNRLVYFDLNDFDESILAPVNWEIARVLTSIMVGFHSLEIDETASEEACALFLRKYSSVLAAGKPLFIETRTAKGITQKFLNTVENRTQKELFHGRTMLHKGKLKLNYDHEKHLRLDKETKESLLPAFSAWMQLNNNASPNNYKVLDVNFRLAGTGSVGIQRYVFLIEKIDRPGKYMLIDMKQATASSLAPYVATAQPGWPSEAKRMETIQRMMQNVAPARLSTLGFEGNAFLMQELQPTKDRIQFKVIRDQFKDMCSVLEDMATLAASAHLRTVGRLNSCTADELMAFGGNPSWQDELLEYARAYKFKVIDDYKSFKASVKSLKHRDKKKIRRIA